MVKGAITDKNVLVLKKGPNIQDLKNLNIGLSFICAKIAS